jgi:hypothetical protein
MASGGWKQAHAAARLAILLSAVAASQVTAASHALAASPVCRQLERELTASRAGGGLGLVRKYDGAIVRQREQLANAHGRASDAGCGFTLFSRNVGQCAAINSSIQRMSANLEDLQSKREKLAGGGSRRDRGRILAALEANRCGEDAAQRRAPLQEAEREGGDTNLLEQLFGGADRESDTTDQPEGPGDERNVRRVLNRTGAPDFPSHGGQFRTSCVRTCDGYFFPMSNSATTSEFERDQKNCESSCPGTEMQVFYSRGMADDSASMTSSVTGRPYRELPTAYLYKRSDMPRPPACGCNAAQNSRSSAAIRQTVCNPSPKRSRQRSPQSRFPCPIPVPTLKR